MGRVLLDSVSEADRRALCWDLISVKAAGGREGGQHVSLRRHLAGVLASAGGGAALVGTTVWSFWYADFSVFEVHAGDGDGDEGDAARQIVQMRSPIRGNWFEAVVRSFDAIDSVIWVSNRASHGPGEGTNPLMRLRQSGALLMMRSISAFG